MATAITLRVGSLELRGELNDSPTGKAIAALMPVTVRMSRWGDEYYGSLPKALGVREGPDAREEMAVGEVAYWPPGNALCLFFGPTPVSSDEKPRAASPVNPVGMVTGDVGALKKMGATVTVKVAKAEA
jgi:hypothetical protein